MCETISKNIELFFFLKKQPKAGRHCNIFSIYNHLMSIRFVDLLPLSDNDFPDYRPDISMQLYLFNNKREFGGM